MFTTKKRKCSDSPSGSKQKRHRDVPITDTVTQSPTAEKNQTPVVEINKTDEANLVKSVVHTDYHTRPKLIHKVRGIRSTERSSDGRYNWEYHGREKNSTDIERLDCAWLNNNRMGRVWRKRHFHKKPGHWFRLSVGHRALLYVQTVRGMLCVLYV